MSHLMPAETTKDRPRYSIHRQHLSLLETEVMTHENLSFLVRESSLCLQAQVRRQWQQASSEYLHLGAIEPCDGRIAGILRHLVSGTEGTLLHITGWRHLASLAALLADLAPELHLLNQLSKTQ